MQNKYRLFSLVLIFYLAVFAFQARAENVARIDSLENILYNSLSYNLSQNEKITICISLSELYDDVSYEKQVEYAIRALILSEEMSDEENLITALKLLSSAYFELNNYNKSIEYSTRLYNIYHTRNDEIKAGEALQMIARNYYNASSYIKSKDYYERALDVFKKNQYFEGVATTLHEMASILGHWGEYDEALVKNQEALSFWDEIGEKPGIASAYDGIGRIYEELGNYDEAFDYYKKSMNLYLEINYSSEIVMATLHLGDIYLKKALYDKALEYYFRAEEHAKQVSTTKRLNGIVLASIGEAYNEKGDYLKALDYLQRSVDIFTDLGDKMKLSKSYTHLGMIYFNVHDFNKALSYFMLGLDIAEEINFKYQINQCNFYLSELYQKTGSYKKSLFHYKNYINGRDAISSEQRKQMVAELQAKYQVEKKEKENERLRHDDQLNNVQIRNQQLVIGFGLFMLLGVIVLSMVFRNRYQQNQKLNIQLALKNKEIEKQQAYVEKLNIELKEANATKDKFFSIVAHDLKSPFSSLLVLSQLLIDDYDTLSNEERKQFIQQINSSAENTFSLLQNLLEWARTQSGRTSINKEQISLGEISNDAISVLKPIAKNKMIELKSNIGVDCKAWADKNMISTVLLNLISNAVKFTGKNGSVSVNSFVSNNHIEIEIADTGVGISKENMEKLFKPDVKFHTVGTEKEKGTGLGLILCKEFIEKNQGEIWVNSDEGKGSKFCFSLPVS